MPTTALLTPVDVEEFGRELDRIREEVIASLGDKDARYTRGVIATHRKLELAGRALLFASWLPPAWVAGTTALATAKILENAENRPTSPRPARTIRAPLHLRLIGPPGRLGLQTHPSAGIPRTATAPA